MKLWVNDEIHFGVEEDAECKHFMFLWFVLTIDKESIIV